MKTAEEWDEAWQLEPDTEYRQTHVNFIKQIQLDAYKAGMTKAAEIAHNMTAYEKQSPVSVAILTARDNTTALP